jgi:hypothetical protein
MAKAPFVYLKQYTWVTPLLVGQAILPAAAFSGGALFVEYALACS